MSRFLLVPALRVFLLGVWMCTGPVLLAWQEDEKEELPYRQRPHLTRNGAEAFFDSEAIRHLCAAIESQDAKELARQLK